MYLTLEKHSIKIQVVAIHKGNVTLVPIDVEVHSDGGVPGMCREDWVAEVKVQSHHSVGIVFDDKVEAPEQSAAAIGVIESQTTKHWKLIDDELKHHVELDGRTKLLLHSGVQLQRAEALVICGLSELQYPRS
mmetsp:Transcript_15997/g.32159  ORF Transcript_15997/g.32159 Transcript_15997/m.32159 type:complete len:133 (+) Transcript_15997:1399-1797(+)